MKVNAKQVKLLRTATGKLGLTEEEYRDLLLQFNHRSSKDLEVEQFAVIMKGLDKLGFKQTDNRLSGNDSGIGNNATTAQLRMIEVMWMEKAREKTREALSKFVKRITGIDKIEWLNVYHIRKVKRAIEGLK
jgi:hypothetical protein